MSELFKIIKKDQLTARKNGEKDKAFLTTLISDATMRAKNDGDREVTDSDIISTIKKFIRDIDETLQSVNKPELKKEKEILESYLPQQFSENELRDIVENIIELLNLERSKKSMGTVMKTLKERYDGMYDGKLASQVAKERLEG